MGLPVELAQLESRRHIRVLRVHCDKHQAVPNFLIDISKIIQPFNMLSFIIFFIKVYFQFKKRNLNATGHLSYISFKRIGKIKMA